MVTFFFYFERKEQQKHIYIYLQRRWYDARNNEHRSTLVLIITSTLHEKNMGKKGKKNLKEDGKLKRNIEPKVDCCCR